MTLSAYVTGVGVVGPGLRDWQHTAAVLCGTTTYTPAPTLLETPARLPAAERRRVGRVVKLALAVAFEASSRASADPAGLASVFTSSGGDGDNCHELCQALTLADREISPTRFSNSVHNAAAGFWSIATGATRESNVLCAFDASFCAGLIEAMTQVVVDREPLLLVAYDTEYPEPINAKRPLPDSFGAALILSPQHGPAAVGRITVSLTQESAESMTDSALESLRAAVPAARCLPLLRRLALRGSGRTVLEYLDVAQVAVEVEPCP